MNVRIQVLLKFSAQNPSSFGVWLLITKISFIFGTVTKYFILIRDLFLIFFGYAKFHCQQEQHKINLISNLTFPISASLNEIGLTESDESIFFMS